MTDIPDNVVRLVPKAERPEVLDEDAKRIAKGLINLAQRVLKGEVVGVAIVALGSDEYHESGIDWTTEARPYELVGLAAGLPAEILAEIDTGVEA